MMLNEKLFKYAALVLGYVLFMVWRSKARRLANTAVPLDQTLEDSFPASDPPPFSGSHA